MPVELKDVLEYINMPMSDDAKLGDFKKAFNDTFVKIENAAEHPDVKKANAGEFTRKYASDLKKRAKENNIELTDEESKMDVTELSNVVFTKFNEDWQTKYTDLESKVNEPNEAMTKLEEDMAKLKVRYDDAVGMKDDLATKLTEKEKEFDTFKTDFTRSNKVKEMWNQIVFPEAAKPLEIEGFKSKMNNDYKFDINESGDLEVFNKEGHQIQDPKKHGEYLKPIDVLKAKQEEFGLSKKSDPEKVTQRQTTTQPTTTKNADGVTRNPALKPMVR